MLLKAQNILKEYGIQEIINIEKLEIAEGEKIGLIGRNGAGKTTLLGLLSGRIPCDSGVITRDCDIAEIRQTGESDGLSNGKYISQFELKDSAIKSGGEKTRLAIASAFSKHVPLMFADEPTTNLDGKAIDLLEKMLIGYKGSVVLISHDRKLLDNVCNKIWELDNGKLRVFDGNYTDWLHQKKRERDFQLFEYTQYKKQKDRLEKSIQSVQQASKKMGKPPKRMSSSEWMLYKGIASVQQGHVQNRARSIASRLEHLEKKERPSDLPNVSMKLIENQKIKAKSAAKISGLTIGFGERVIIQDISLEIESGKKTFLIGDNGTGKTTIIKALLQRQEGTFITSDAKVAYFSQEQDHLDMEKTVLDNVVCDAAFPNHICRAVLANLCMSKLDIEKKVKVLSGGERVKTAIAKILVSGCNFMILDEPTNHMDIYAMEGLEELLSDYDGTLLAVSHDRQFVENLADRVFEIKEGKVINHK